jgi:arylsulfatase A-like enzyme
MIVRVLSAAGRAPAALLLACLTALTAGALHAVRADGPAPAPETSRPGGVLLVSIDGLRADRVGVPGPTPSEGGGSAGGASVTPALDALAARGVRFTRAYTASPATGPGNATLLTGLRPARHGWRRDNAGRVAVGTPTLAARFKAAGWYTAAIVGTRWLNSEFGLAQGFDRYDDDMKGILKEHIRHSPERRASDVVDRALQVLDQAPGGKPFFLWVNLHDPDYDFDPPQPQKSTFASDPYLGEVAAADAGLAALAAGLEARGLTRSTTLVLAGSHGEGLSEHDEAVSGTLLYDTTIHVPLVMAGPKIAADGRSIDLPVSLADVAPTLLDLAGVAAAGSGAAGGTGGGGLDGRSRAGWIAAGASWSEGAKKRAGKEAGHVFAEAVHPLQAFGWSALAAAIDGTHKVVQGARLEAFDLASDPKEERPIPKPPAWAGALQREASAYLQPLGLEAGRRRRIDEAVAKVHFPWDNSPFCVEKTGHPDPRDPDRRGAAGTLFQMQLDAERNLPGFAWNKAQNILQLDPSNLAALDAEAEWGLGHGWGDMLLDPLELMVCNYPYQGLGYHRLGHFYSARRDWAAARDAFGLMILVEPENQEAEYDLACTLLELDDKDGALAHLKASIDLGGDDFGIIRVDPRLVKLHDDPRFKALLPGR